MWKSHVMITCMQSSILKQFIYGVFYILIIIGVGYGMYLLVLQPAPTCFDTKQNQRETGIDCGGPCESCVIRDLKPITVSRVSIFENHDGTFSAVTELRNPNVLFGASLFTYQLNLFSDNNEIFKTITKTSFIYPGEIKFIIEPGIRVNAFPVRGEVVVQNPTWKENTVFSLPQSQVRGLHAEIDEPGSRVIVRGVLMNQNPFSLSRAVVSAVLRESIIPTAASQTLLLDILPGEERAFQITLPLIDISRFALDKIFIYAEVQR
jgi:hypothetical protein